MKSIAIILVFILANTLFQCAKPALNAFAENPLMWTKGMGYFPLVAISVIVFVVVGRKYLVK